MSRTIAAVAAAFAFTALVAGGAPARAQANDPISGTSPGAARPMAPMSSTQSAPMPSAAMPGSSTEATGRPMRRARAHRAMRRHHAMQGGRHAMRGSMRGERGMSGNDGAYMGGGAVYERTPDGGLRPVM